MYQTNSIIQQMSKTSMAQLQAQQAETTRLVAVDDLRRKEMTRMVDEKIAREQELARLQEVWLYSVF